MRNLQFNVFTRQEFPIYYLPIVIWQFFFTYWFIFQLLKSGGAGSGNGFGGRNLTSPTSSPSKRPRKLKSPIPSGSFHYGSSGHHTPMSMGSGCSALGLMPMSAPAKICQTSPALDLLENKKKVQRNSLYHWVLWREALRGEKDRTNPNNPMPLPRSRLSFNWKVGVAWNRIKLGHAQRQALGHCSGL